MAKWFSVANQIRYLDGPIPTAGGDVAIQVNGAKKLIVGDNLIESANPQPIQWTRCNEDMRKLYDNLDPADFIRQAEDALMMSLMAKR